MTSRGFCLQVIVVLIFRLQHQNGFLTNTIPIMWICLTFHRDIWNRHTAMRKGLRKNFNTAAIPEEEARKSRAAYYACCEFLDECIGDLLTILERDGLLENTIIVYTTDHGEMAGEHGQWWKSSYYEAAARVPLIIHDRRAEDTLGRRVNAPAELNDLFPTLCARAGIPIPEGLDGSDLSNLMSGNTDGWRNTAISEYWANQSNRTDAYVENPSL